MSEIVLGLDKPANDGSCVGRSDGRVVFCRHGLPGETVRAAVVDGGPDSRFWRAEALAVVGRPAAERVASPCPWSGPGQCGGCSWLHAHPDAQLDFKTQVLAETLERIGGIHWPVEVRTLGRVSGWRTRLSLHVDDEGRAGFHAWHSHEVVSVADCLQADPRMDLPGLLEQSWPAGATVRVSVSEAGRAVTVDSATGVSHRGAREHLHVVDGREFRTAADGFWQSHVDAASVLTAQVRELVPRDAGSRIVDLYSGVGLFGLALLDSHEPSSVELVEGDRSAAEFAVRNCGGDPRVDVIPRDVRRWARGPRTADVVVLDPPRAGAGKQVVSAIARTGARTVVYVSCDAATLARDLRWFVAMGYQPDQIVGFDLFPGTAHLETVVRLRASGQG
ncbi:MAG: methyltransferase [Candidatus Nanopelagicales bacterium]